MKIWGLGLCSTLVMPLFLMSCIAPSAEVWSSSGDRLAPQTQAKSTIQYGIESIAYKYGLPKIWLFRENSNNINVRLTYGAGVHIDDELEIGSLSKSITAIAIALLIQDNKISLDSKLSEILPEYLQKRGRKLPPSLDAIDIRHLLGHRAGLRPNYASNPDVGLATGPILRRLSPGADFTDYLFSSGSYYSDGTSNFAYSNLSYATLGMVIEAVSGEDYEIFCRTRILAPLGLRGHIPTNLRTAAPFSGWMMPGEDFLMLWRVFDITNPTLLGRNTLENTLLSRVLAPIEPGTDVYYTLATYVRENPVRTGYVISHNGLVDILRGQPTQVSFSERNVPGDAWFLSYQIPASTARSIYSSAKRTEIVNEVRQLLIQTDQKD